MEEMIAQLETLTAALTTALDAGDHAAFGRIAQGRAPIVAACVARWAELAPADQEHFAPRLQAVLRRDGALIAAGHAWLAQARGKLQRLQRGMATVARYRAPLDLLPRGRPN